MIVVIRTLNGQEQILCHEPGQPRHWCSLETERLLGFDSTQKFDTEHGAEQAALMMGGRRVTMPDPEPLVLPAFLMQQAE